MPDPNEEVQRRATQEHMNKIAQVIKAMLPADWGFFLLAAPYGQPDGLYRYRLDRWFDDMPQAHPLIFCMLNPSTADAEKDDPTIRRCLGFAEREGLDGIIILNAFAYRTSIPKELRAKAEARVDVRGPENEKYLFETTLPYTSIVCAWGASPITEDMDWFSPRMFWDWGLRTYHLGRTKGGQPRHPLYVKADQPLIEFSSKC